MLNRNTKAALLSLFFLVGILSEKSRAEILTIKSVEAFEKHLKEQDYTHSDMVVFDVDMVLTMPRNPTFQMPTFKKYRKEHRRFMRSIPKLHHDVALLYMLMESPQVATHEKMVEAVKSLQKKKVMTLFLTDLPTGAFYQMSSAAEWRALTLMSAGYDIQNDPVEAELYKDFSKHLGSYPKRAGHLLMTNGQDGSVTKGLLLVHYLTEKSLTPTRILMVDDRLKNVKNVEAEIARHYPGIKFTGIHYLAASHVKDHKVKRKAFKKALRKIKKLVKKNKDLK